MSLILVLIKDLLDQLCQVLCQGVMSQIQGREKVVVSQSS